MDSGIFARRRFGVKTECHATISAFNSDHDLQHRQAGPEEGNPEFMGIGTATKTT
jgi:hypothetical protein